MVIGLKAFAAAFAGLEDRYVLIGGAAAHLRFRSVGLEFRTTRDLDLVLTIDALGTDFPNRFWAFIEDGDYEIRQRTDGSPIKYRFMKPSRAGFPHMIELFADASFASDPAAEITPVPIDGEHSNLSAILLDEAYREVTARHRSVVEGVSCLTARGLILLKASAWLDLTARREAGERIDSRDIKKHRNDGFRLAQLLDETDSPSVPPGPLEDLRLFLETDGGHQPHWPAIKAACKGLRPDDPETLIGIIRSSFEIPLA